MRSLRLRSLSLRTSLRLSAALGIAAVVGGLTYLENRIFQRVIEDEARDAAVAATKGVAADLRDGESAPGRDELRALLADYQRAVPAMRGLSLARTAADSTPRLLVSTFDQPEPLVLELAAQAARGRGLAADTDDERMLQFVAVPLEARATGATSTRPHPTHTGEAVVVTLSTEGVERVERQIRLTAFTFAAVALIVLTGVVDLMALRLVHTPLEALRSTMARASAGDLQQRARVERRDEIGAVADGLNAMLARMGDFNHALRHEVERATERLRDSNQKLEDSAQRLFAARRELARSEQLALAGQMAATVAHQIGTPLNLISGYVQMMLAEQPDGSGPARRLDLVQQQIAKVTTIVQGLQDQARRPVLHRRPVVAAALIEGVVELARPTLDSRRVALTLDVPADLPRILVDAGQLEQVFLNLITNSLDAMPDGGLLAIAAREAGGGVDFIVADSGTGIAAEHLAHIFDPLFTTKDVGKGTGLGLAIVRDLVAAHDGSVSVTSELGRGTTVTVRLPGLPAERTLSAEDRSA